MVDTLALHIGGRTADIDGDLKTLRFLKMMLVDVDKVVVAKSQHDENFTKMLNTNG